MSEFGRQLERRRQWANLFYAFIFICVFASVVGGIAVLIIKALSLD